MTSPEPVPEQPVLGNTSVNGRSSAESNVIASAKRAPILALAAMALFASVLGLMFTIVSTAGILGVLGVIVVLLLLAGAVVLVSNRQTQVARGNEPTALTPQQPSADQQGTLAAS